MLEAVRFAELHSWLDQPGVVLPANEDFHYEGPNGCRYESFMRVGTAIQGMETLDAISFWLQPHLRGVPAVVLDAWTINSVALNLGRYARNCGAPCEPVADIECLGAYDEDMDKLKLRLTAIRKRLDPGPALLVSSVVSKGDLHRELENLIKKVGFEDVRSVALYGHADSATTVFCRPAEVGRYWAKDEECPLPTPSIPIAPATYLAEVAIMPKREAIRKHHVEQAAGFFTDYGGADFLTVHRDEPGGGRHHMIHLDVERLVRHPRFSERLDDELKPLNPDIVLAPTNTAARTLAKEVEERLRVEAIVADETTLSELSEQKKEKLRRAERILLVDDVMISGSRLLGYRNFLRRCDLISEDHVSEVHLLVGAARAPNNRAIAGLGDTVDLRDRLHRVETLVLPDWGESECPWCWERRLLDEVGPTLPRTERLERRWEALAGTHVGLRNSLFMPWLAEGADQLPVPVWKLGPGSVFQAKSEVDLFVAVASSVQTSRAADDLSERYSYPLASVLDPPFWISGRYYDAVIAAAILRATRRHDVRAMQIEPELLAGITSRLSNGDELRGELILAMARGHLPVGAEITADDGVLADESADPGFAGLMRRALERPANSR